MKVLHDKLVVRFDDDHNYLFDVGGVQLIRVEEWLHKDEEGKQTFQENLDYRETKPQIAVVTHPNEKYPYQVGDKLFLHYMAHTTATYADEKTKDAFIFEHYVFLTFNEDGTYKMADKVYLGEQLVTDDETTPNGIIINVLGNKPKLCQIELKHLPENSPFEKGQVVISIDSNQYKCTIDGKEYIMLRESEIVATLAYAAV